MAGEGLTISRDGHCSRGMPIAPGKVHRILLRFSEIVSGYISCLHSAKNLELDEEIEILFSISNADFDQLQRTIDYFSDIDRGST